MCRHWFKQVPKEKTRFVNVVKQTATILHRFVFWFEIITMIVIKT